MPIINHQAIQNNWTTPEQIVNPQTLILGSFNPFDANGNIVDYYYGRRSNYLWKRIAIIMGYDEEYFFDIVDGMERKLNIMNNRFCFLDVINRIEVIGQNIDTVSQYINNNIFTNFADSKIFARSVLRGEVHLSREYNNSILETLANTQSITKVIHTMGNSRILTPHNVNPLELQLGINGFSGFMNLINEACINNGIEFVNQSLSPSAYAVRNGAVTIENLDVWLIEHLSLQN